MPRSSQHGWTRTTGDVLPLTHAADAARRPADGGGIARGPVGAECGAGAGYALLAMGPLVVFERGGGRRATPDVM
ncbi:hypothetical protein DT019_28305 [Streptomyces sp. SDr-06]|uniref:hypothetical protein n=1 Tax=Streptomyces sp. SDr-06 TaxID=2267702 RepID=UPI000DEB477A|nr:hypothetical protein [Streptomyces sp. SDr-06]RCH65375.1 hypothetical protein DT019_28305 [Streptomyces sp. SDr-06]